MAITVNKVEKRKPETIEVAVFHNRNGKAVPATQVSPYHRRRDRLVKKLHSRAEKLQAYMKREKAAMMSDINKFVQYAAESKKYNKELNVSGNLILSDYGSLLKVEMKRQDIIEFDERLNVAKGIIDNLLKDWADDSVNENLRQIVVEAFNMDKKGSINKAMIFKLINLPIKHPDWEKAVAMIRESVDVKGSKDYIQFKKRKEVQGEFESIELNFGALKITEE